MKLLALACLLIVFSATPMTARADTMRIFSLQAVMPDGYTSQGAVVLDVTTGEVAASNFTLSQSGVVAATFTDSSNSTFDGFYQATFVGSDPGYIYVLLFPQADLTAYAGGSLCSENVPCDGYASGSFVPNGWEPSIDAGLSPVPEPSSLSLLTTGAIGMLAFARRKLASG